MAGRPKKQTPQKMAKEIINASFGHIKENQTLVKKPQTETKNVTTVEDLKKSE